MKIIEVIKHSAELLGLQEAVAVLSTATEENEDETLGNEQVKKLLNLAALSIQELCSNYISVFVEEKFETFENKIPLKNLHNYIRTVGVTKDDVLVKHKIVNRNIVLEEDGKYVIKYCTYPSIMSLFDEVDFLSDLSPDVLVMALCSYYSIAHGMFKEFEVFHEQYISKAQALKELKIFELPLRRWAWTPNI